MLISACRLLVLVGLLTVSPAGQAADPLAPIVNQATMNGTRPGSTVPDIVVYLTNVAKTAGVINCYSWNAALPGKWAYVGNTPVSAGQTIIVVSPTGTYVRYDFVDNASRIVAQADPKLFTAPGSNLQVFTAGPDQNGKLQVTVDGSAIDPAVSQIRMEVWAGKTLIGAWKAVSAFPGANIHFNGTLPLSPTLDMNQLYVVRVWSQKWTSATALANFGYGASVFGRPLMIAN
jgi:hypothetical protein